MSALEALKVLQETIGPAPTSAISELVRATAEETKNEMLSRTDEKIAGRYAEIHRRVSSDIHAAVEPMRADIAAMRIELREGLAELRAERAKGDAELRAQMEKGNAELREAMQKGDAELREAMGIGDAELRLAMVKGDSDNRTLIHDLHAKQLRWIVTVFVIQGLVILAYGWASKHLL